MIKALTTTLLSLLTTISMGCYASTPPKPSAIITDRDVTLSWTHTDKREDGTIFTAEDLSHYEIFYGLKSVEGPATMVNSGKGESFTIPNLKAGDWQFWMWTVDTDNVTSELSEEINLTIVTQSRPVVSGLEVE